MIDDLILGAESQGLRLIRNNKERKIEMMTSLSLVVLF